MQLYVCGFGFHWHGKIKRLVLCRDGDFLNGVWGRVSGERTITTMRHAWEERTGRVWERWTRVGELKLPDREVRLFKAFMGYGDIAGIDDHSEYLMTINPDNLQEYDVHESLRWIVPLCLLDEPPRGVTAEW